MSPEPVKPSLPRSLALAAAVWGIGAVVYATHLYLFHLLQGEPTPLLRELAEAAVHFGVWALLTPLVLWLARRLDLLTSRWPQRLAVHLPLSLLVALLQMVAHTLLDLALLHGGTLDPASVEQRLRNFFGRTYYANVIVYFVLVLGSNGLALVQRRKLRESELERYLAQAQLESLRQQLQPHFLFNALHAIAALIGEDPPAAQRMVARLSDLLRLVLDQRHANEVPLRRELELARSYLAIEQVRFQDRLRVDVDVEAGAEDALVPGLLLQPLLENAIRHGIARKPGPGRIEVAVHTVNGRLLVRVRDDGEGLGGSSQRGSGIGLANVRARLERLYGADARLELRPSPAGGAEAVVELPLHREPRQQAAARTA